MNLGLLGEKQECYLCTQQPLGHHELADCRYSQRPKVQMSSKKMTISDGLCAVAFGTTVATGIIAGVELEMPPDQANPDDKEVHNDGQGLYRES